MSKTILRRENSNSNTNCSVFGCKSVTKNNRHLSFHRIPRIGENRVYAVDESNAKPSLVDRGLLWQRNLKLARPVTTHMKVCSLHFRKDDYIVPQGDYIIRRVLKRTAVPTQNLPAIKSRKLYHYNRPLKEEYVKMMAMTGETQLEETSSDSKQHKIEAVYIPTIEQSDSDDEQGVEVEPKIAIKEEIFEEPEDEIFDIVTMIQDHHCAFQSSKSGLINLKKSLSEITTKEQWESFLCRVDNEKPEGDRACKRLATEPISTFTNEDDEKEIKTFVTQDNRTFMLVPTKNIAFINK